MGKHAYKGYLYHKCSKCGVQQGVCVKEKVDGFRCRECRQFDRFEHHLTVLWVNCELGHQSKYMTDMTEPMFDVECPVCGIPVAIEYNKHKGLYNPIREKN